MVTTHKIFYFLGIIFMLQSMASYPQSEPSIEVITNTLKNKGYENLYVSASEGNIYITYENRVYRWGAKAIVDVINTVIPLSNNCKELHLVMQYLGISISRVVLNIDKVNDYKSGGISPEDFRKSIYSSYDIGDFQQHSKNYDKKNTSFNKFDVVVHPQFRVQLGDFNNPFKPQINIAPAVNITFWPGMELRGQVIFPLYNELEQEGDYIRLGLLAINQIIRLPSSTLASISVGYFTNERYGVNLDVRKFFLDGKLSVGGNAGYTGHASVLEHKWSYSEVDLINWFTNITYRDPTYDLTIKLGYGSFIAEDKGWRCDLFRQFGETMIGFYGMETNGVVNGGFNFVVPIPPRKYATKRMIRIRPASYFPWEYRYKGLSTEGQAYYTGSDLNTVLILNNPDFIKNEILKQLSNIN